MKRYKKISNSSDMLFALASFALWAFLIMLLLISGCKARSSTQTTHTALQSQTSTTSITRTQESAQAQSEQRVNAKEATEAKEEYYSTITEVTLSKPDSAGRQYATFIRTTDKNVHKSYNAITTTQKEGKANSLSERSQIDSTKTAQADSTVTITEAQTVQPKEPKYKQTLRKVAIVVSLAFFVFLVLLRFIPRNR